MLPEYPDVRFDGPPNVYNDTPYDKRYVAIHNTSNDASDAAEADYAQRRTDASSHYYVDHDSITQSLRTEYGAAHAGSSTGNRHAIAYEITGSNGKSRTWWLANVAWPLLARQIARDCRKHSIDVKVLTVEQMRDGRTTGIVTHDLMRRAWGGTTHTDPGPNFPMDYLIALVRAELEGEADDMTPGQSYVLHVMNYRIDAIKGLKVAVVIPPYTAPDGTKFPGMTEPCQLGIWAAQQTASDEEIEQLVRETLQEVSDDEAVPEVVLTPEQIAAVSAAVVQGVTTAIDVPTAAETAEAVADELHERTAP